MADLHNVWGSDVVLSSTGDLLLVDASEAGRQRVLRRLLTVAGMYIWQLDYGAGLPAQVGETTSSATIEAVARRQMLLEPAVAQDPAPSVRVTPIFGGMIVHVQYVDATTSRPMQVGFTVER